MFSLNIQRMAAKDIKFCCWNLHLCPPHAVFSKKFLNLTPLSKLGKLGSEQVCECYKLLIKGLSVKVTLKYVIFSRVLQKLSKEYQPMAPHLFFLVDIMLLYFWWKFQIGRRNQPICQGIQSLCGAVPHSKCIIVAWWLYKN